MVAEAIDMVVSDEIAALQSSGQIENPGWERAFGNIADEVARRDGASEVSSRALTFPAVSTETKDRDLVVAALESEVEQLRTLVQALKFHTEENAQLRRVCVDQAEQIADLRAACSVSDRPRAVPPRHRWRTEPPRPDEVTECQWWWNKSSDGMPHVLQLDRDLGSGLIFDAGESTSGACPSPFDPLDWPGEWAPCMTPDNVTARVSRIAEAGKRLVMSHVGKVKTLRAQLALETAALELACSVDVHAQITVAAARQLAAVERGHDTSQVCAVRERALKDHMTEFAERAGRR